MPELRKLFAKRLKVLRSEKQITQEELANSIGRSASFISGLERGIESPSFETLESIAKSLNVPIKDLFDF